MKKTWARRLALALVLCLLSNNCICELPMLVHAETADSAASTVTSGDATVSTGNSLQRVATMSMRASDVSEMYLPSTVAEYVAVRDAGRTTFYIASYEDFMDAQSLCADPEVNGFDGITLMIASPTGTDIWNLMGDLTDDSGNSLGQFTGIGTADYPFAGTLQCYFGSDGGVQLNTETPLFQYLGAGATVTALNIKCDSAHAVIAENILGAEDDPITISDIILIGSVENSEGSAGVIAANIKDDSSVIIADVNTYVISENGERIPGAVTVSGAVAGGIAGAVGDNVSIAFDTTADGTATDASALEIQITGTQAVGGHFGTVTGSYTWNLADESKLNVAVSGGNKDCYAGYFAGKLLSSAEASGELNISGGNSVAVNVSGAGNGGGLLGLCGSNAIIAKPEGDFTVSGSVEMDWADTSSSSRGNAGGLVGVLEDTSMIFADYIIETVPQGMKVGGIAGEIRGGKYIVKDVEVKGGFWGHNTVGGVAGNVTDSAAIEIQGTLKVAESSWLGTNKPGLVAGTQDGSLIYFSEIEGLLDGELQLSGLADCPEISTYGGVYRNQAIDGNTTKKLIGDGTLENVGVINHTIPFVDGAFQLDAVEDFETLAIALGTDGAYGMTNADASAIFEGVAEPDFATLLKASYDVTKSVEISYDKTGIVTLNRNDVEDEEHAFSGTMTGVGTDITITQNISEKQDRVGVFSTIAGDVTFENLTFAGKIENATGAGGIAYQIIDTDASANTALTLTDITMEREFANNTGVIGGVLAEESSGDNLVISATDVTLASTITAGSVNKSSGFITNVKKADISMENIVLGGTFTCESGSETGGFLGRSWEEIGGIIKKVSVQAGTTYEAAGKFGGMLETVTTAKGERLTFDTVALDGFTVNANSEKKNCSLLVRDGKAAIIEVIDYDSTGCVVNNPGSHFDEIVAEATAGPLSSGQGIVSIHSRDGKYPAYFYQNKAENLVGKSNQYVKYFYDVFQWLETDNGDGTVTNYQFDNTVIDSPQKALLWDIVHYAKSGNVRSTFEKYFSNGVGVAGVSSGESYSFANESGKTCLDLSQISFYPVIDAGGTYTGTGDVVIKFDAQTIAEAGVPISAWGGRHYGLQGGLFSNAGAMNISDMTLTGTIANLDYRTGALVGGNAGVGKASTFTNITLDDLWVYGYDASGATIGLMVSCVPNTSATFDGIKMEGYDKDSTTKAAAALIGSAGSEDATDLIVNFRNMVIADDADDLATSHNGDVLAYASFIYNYNYTDQAEINNGYGLYLFDEEDCPTNVTYGLELDESTEFNDNTNLVLETLGIQAEDYKPYVYQVKDIEVNPKSGDILKGCGTYEDPYIIEDLKQLLTLARFMNETGNKEDGYKYENFYKNWKVIKPGDDSEFCEGNHAEADAVVFTDDDFPTPEDMSRAYYQLNADIDLSQKMSNTYKIIAEDFVGLGTEDRPFIGVWVGKTDTDGNNLYTITLPSKEENAEYEAYGFIQYAKGAVIKDINIATAESKEATEDTEAVTVYPTQIKTMGGSVIACILGGDNIIDNVNVDVDFRVADVNAVIGGYVGNVKKGGLILRKVSETALKNFALDKTTSGTSYELLGAIAGKVEDGYVLYEGSAEDSLLWTGTGGNTTYPQIPNYTVLNGDKLKSGSAGLEVVKADNQITITIPSAEALQVMSMALNADVLNVRPSDYSAYTACGYTELSRSRKAAYSDIGCDDANTVDYISAAKYDNVMNYTQNSYTNADTAFAYPYLYQYMGITGEEYLDYLVGEYSVLNPAIVISGNSYIVQWNLAEAKTYDMSQFTPEEKLSRSAFRGLGGLYGTGVEYGGAFHGNFDGKNSTVNIEMSRVLLGESDRSNTSIQAAGLFNVLYGRAESLYTEPADFGGDTKLNCATIKNIILSGNIAAEVTTNNFELGGIVARINDGDARYIFDNIVVKGLKATGRNSSKDGVSQVGGIVGAIGTSTNVLLNECHVLGTAEKNVELRGNRNVAGLVGITKATVLKITNSEVEYLTAQSGWNNAAGFVGWVNYNAGKLICEGTADTYNSVKNSTFDGHERAGGFVGGTASVISLSDVSAEAIQGSAYNHIGGIVGSLGDNKTSFIENATVKNLVTVEENLYGGTSGIGGIVGKNDQNLSIQGAKVLGDVNTDKTYQCNLDVYNNKVRSGSSGVGGIVGAHTTRTLTLTDCEVDSVSLRTDVAYNNVNGDTTFTVSVGAGGMVGYVSAAIVMDGTISATNLKIEAPLQAEGKQVTMAAGGCFGTITESGTITGTVDGTYHNGLIASGNTVSGKQAGGVIGAVSEYQTNVRLTGITVENGTVTSDEAAGGVFGYCAPSWQGIALHNTATNTVNNMQITGKMAGGLAGQYVITGPSRVESLMLTNNAIIANRTADQITNCEEYSAGGVMGSCGGSTANTLKLYNVKLSDNLITCEVVGTALSAEEIDCLAVGGILGRMYTKNANNVSDILCDNLVISEANEIGVRQTSANPVQLIYNTGTGYQLKDVAAPSADGTIKDYQALQQLTGDYGYYVGTIVGVVQSENVQLYVLRSVDTGSNTKFVTPVLTNNPPVTDVGRTSAQEVDAYRSYCHIIYGAENSKAADADDNLADMKAQVDLTNAVYEGTETLQQLLQEYRLSARAVELFTEAYKEKYTGGTTVSIDFPILVYRTEYGTIQEFMEYITDIMTNVAGASASDIDSDYLTITCKPKLCNGTTVTDGAEGSACITAVTADGQTTYELNGFDGLKDSNLSYTELVFTYGWSGSKKIFRLPVYVEEPILYSVQSRLMEGRVTDVATLREKGITDEVTEVILANDSDYTWMLEYTYGKARKNMPDGTEVDKVFSLTSIDTVKNLPTGTRLMLVDVTKGNKAYYYTVDSEVSQLKFTDFEDSHGNPYENTSINKLEDEKTGDEEYYIDLAGNQLTETGVERFLLTVLAVNTESDKAYSIHAGTAIENADLASRFMILEHENYEYTGQVTKRIIAIPGLEISFRNKGTDTDIDGVISKERGLTVKGSVALQAKDIHWVQKNAATVPVIDSSNNNKYLELAFYLRDKDGNRVKFPAGTNFAYHVEGMDGYSENKVIPNDSVIYFYKDIRDAFEQEDSEYLIGNLTQNTTVDVAFTLDFSGTDMATITEESYQAWLDLLRTANKEYPMGSGNKLDSYDVEVEANADQALGFAVRAEDLSQLAINTYPVPAETNTIDYNVMFDFGEVLQETSGFGKAALLAKWSGYDYTVTYQIYRKVQNGDTVEYVKYDGGNDGDSENDTITLTAVEGAAGGDTTSTDGTMITLYQFTVEELEADDGFISFPCKVTMKTEELTADVINLTNYKIEAKLVITERDSAVQPTEETTDFFIYTVTRLKTDL